MHFDLKKALDVPEAVMSDNTVTFGEPVRPGDRLRTWQVLRNVSTPKKTKLGMGRFWDIDVEYQNQRGEWVGRSYTGSVIGGTLMASRVTPTGEAGDALPELPGVSPIDIVLGALRAATGGPSTTTTSSPPSATACATSS